MKVVDRCLALEPENMKALLRKANIQHFLKEYHKALQTYQDILKIDPENVDAKNGIHNTQRTIQGSMNEGNDEDRLRRAMSDPEIQQIMMDPMIKIALGKMQESPQEAQKYFTDSSMGPKLQKLIAAGVLKVG